MLYTVRIEFMYIVAYLFNVYFPCDTNNNEYLQEYNDVLSDISSCMIKHNIDYCIIAGDLNTDLSRVNSGNTLSLQSFVEKENLSYALKTFSKDVQYTFTGIQHNHSLLDYFIVSQNLIDTNSHYFTADSVDNLSDHLPLFCHLSSVIEYVLYAECDNIGTSYITSKSQHSELRIQNVYSDTQCLFKIVHL